jgi:hypothetical protein
MLLQGRRDHSTMVRLRGSWRGNFDSIAYYRINFQTVGKRERSLLERRRIKAPSVVAYVHREGQSPVPSDHDEKETEFASTNNNIDASLSNEQARQETDISASTSKPAFVHQGVSRGETLLDIMTGNSQRQPGLGEGQEKKRGGWWPWGKGVEDQEDAGLKARERRRKTVLEQGIRCSKQDAIPIIAGGDNILKPVLPWLYMLRSNGKKLRANEFSWFASKMNLARIHVVEVSEKQGHGIDAEHVKWMGATSLPTPAVSLAATLHRLYHRFAISDEHGDTGRTGCLVVVSYDEETQSQLVQDAICLFLHLYCNVPDKESRNLSHIAIEKRTSYPSPFIIESGIEELAACGQGWLQRVPVEWPYAGSSAKVEVAGELVGGWHCTMPLVYNTRHRKWILELWGLPPGPYPYKFVVYDNNGQYPQWLVDPRAPCTIDEWNNVNNIVNVVKCAGTGMQEWIASQDGDGMGASMAKRNEVDAFFVDDAEMFSLVGGGERKGGSLNLEPVSKEQRLRLAQFGALILAYYNKILYSNNNNE